VITWLSLLFLKVLSLQAGHVTVGFVCRSDLTKKAEKASISVFAANLKQLLLTPPVRGKSILGIDPGFHNGCKFAIISATGK